MAEKKLNKDGLIPGEPVSEKDYLRVMNEQRKKDPYMGIGVSAKKTVGRVKKQNTEEYAREAAIGKQANTEYRPSNG